MNKTPKPALKPTTWPVINLPPQRARGKVRYSKEWAVMNLLTVMATMQERADMHEHEHLFGLVVSGFEQAWVMRGQKGGPR